ncbi:oligosaccharide flippase family protein [Rummeliibacillus sp. NPDC094406]|uniref:oligosaccharide flippase family protein n=1 Tax=Rummeliibacillus sp. NPDC094406 TaxID=3364511 RepID=UPI003809A5A9
MNVEITKTKVISSLLWKLLERGGTQGIQFIVTLILARLLLPEDFGLIVLITIFISIAGIFVQSGFNTALIQKKDADEVDFSSIFYLSLIVACVLYLILFITAPFIASFFEKPDFSSVLRVLSFSLFLGAFNSIQVAIIERNLQFKKLFFSSFGAIVASGIVGIVMAYAHLGVWALVGQQLTNQLIVLIILWFTLKWRPRLVFSIKRIKNLFAFSWKLLAAALLDSLYFNLCNLIVGKLFSPTMLGFYNRGEQFPNLIVTNIDGSIHSVMFPTLSSYQDNVQRIKEIIRRSIMTSSFLIFPTMVGLAIIADPLVRLLLTEKWLPAVPFLQIYCAIYALWPIHTTNLQVINALGRSDLFFKIEIVKKVLSLIILAISIPFGIFGIVWGGVVSGIFSTFINTYPNIKLINYGYKEQWRDIMPSLFLSLVMGTVIYTINWFEIPALLKIIIQVIVGIILYLLLAKVLKMECFTYLLSTLNEMLRSKKKTKIINKEVQKMKRLLVLNGNYTQIPAIKKSREMGHYVITCDNLEENPGHKYAHEYHNVSYTDREGVLDLAKSLKIDGIVCFATDAAAPTVAYVAEKLGLPSNPFKSVDIITNKDKFRLFLEENNFSVPKAGGYNTFEEAKNDFHNFKMPVMIKPVDSSASRGVSKIDSIDLLQEKVENALSFSLVKRFIIEEYIEKQGYQVEGDVFSVNGKLVFHCFANGHFIAKYLNPVNSFAATGPSWPSTMPEHIQNKIHEEIQRLLNLLDMKTGPCNFDIQIDAHENVYFLDMGARNGGHLIPYVTKYATDVDMIEYTIKAALGEECSDLTMVEPNGYWSAYLINSQKSGEFKEVKIDDQFIKSNIVEYDLKVKAGDSISAYIGSNAILGTMILKFSSMDEMLDKMDNITNWVKVIVEDSLVTNS